MNRQQIAFARNLLHLDIDMAQNAEAVVELLDDMHRGKCLPHMLQKMENLCKTQALQSKALSYKSIDVEARSMRNNIVIYGLTENIHRDATNLVRAFIENKLDIDTSEMYIERAHRIEKGPRTNESKRPMVIRFRDYVDTEIIMEKTYKLKGTPFGIDRQYPREIARARSELYNSHEARDARSRRLKMQIGYPARLYVEGKMVKDKFPDWYETLNMDRLGNTTTDTRNNTTDTRNRQDRKHYSVYSNDTVVGSTITRTDRRSHSENEEVFEVADNIEHSCEESDRCLAPMEVNKSHKTAAYEEKQNKINNKPCADQCPDSSA